MNLSLFNVGPHGESRVAIAQHGANVGKTLVTNGSWEEFLAEDDDVFIRLKILRLSFEASSIEQLFDILHHRS